MKGIFKVFNGVKQGIMRCDLLAAAPTLRVRGQPAYESVLGGFLSITIMSFFIVVFYSNFMDVFKKIDISSTMSSMDNTESTTDVTDIQFAVGIEDVQLGAGPRYFDIFMQQVTISGNNGSAPVMTKTQVRLEPCNIDDWQDVGDHFKEQFNAFGMTRMLCMSNGSSISLKGYQGSPDYSYITLKVKQCTNNSGDTHVCKPRTEIDAYIDSYLDSHDFFKVRFLIVDIRITPGDQDPISKIIEKKIFLSFTSSLGTKGFISFAHYSVTTDTSIIPYPSQVELQGSYIHKYSMSTIGLSSDRYIYLQFFKATEQLSVTRSVAKIDEMLSYVGGLFGLLWVIVAFFLASFNQYRYELYASEAAFTFDDTGKKIKEKDFGLITYFGYSIYDWLNTFGLAPTCWTKMRQIDQARQEVCEQLDVTYLFRKIRSLQKTTACLLNQNKRICSMLTRQPTLQETQQERKLLELYSKLNPSPCQSHSNNNPNNKVENSGTQQSGQNFVLGDKIMNGQETQSEMQNMSCVTDPNFEQDEEYEQIMNIIRDAYSSIEGQNDQICKRIKQKIPKSIKRAMQKKQYTRKLIVQDIGIGRFQSCQNSLMQAKLK